MLDLDILTWYGCEITYFVELDNLLYDNFIGLSIIVNKKKNKINHNNSDFIQEESSSQDKGTNLGQTIDTE